MSMSMSMYPISKHTYTCKMVDILYRTCVKKFIYTQSEFLLTRDEVHLVNLQVLEVLDLCLFQTAAVGLYRVMESHTFF